VVSSESGWRGLLALLTETERGELSALGHERSFARGATLFNAGDPSDWVLVILEGRVKVSTSSAGGKEVVLAIREPGELLGELSAVDGHPRSGSASAIDATRVLTITAPDLRTFLESHPRVSFLLLETVVGRLRDSDRRRVEFTALDSVGRVALRLVELADRFGTATPSGIRVDLSISHDELAGWTGLSREAVGKAMQVLRSRGWIRTARRSVEVVDVEALRSRAS